MSQLLKQNPGLGGLDELTNAEEIFITNLAALPYTTGDILYYNGSNLTNTDILFIDGGNSRVGIGTTTPAQKFSIVGNIRADGASPSDSAYIILNDPDGKATALGAGQSNSIFMYDDTGGFQIQARTKAQILAGEGSSASGKFVIDSYDRVGIGNPTPNAQLEVSNYGHGSRTPLMISSNTDTNGDLMTILNNGNLGIGTTSPNRILGIGGLVARNIGMERGTVANTAGFDLTLNSGGATSAATDKAGGDLILQSGIATGNGGSEMELQITEASQGAGTADRSPTTVVKIDNTKSTLVGDGGTTNYAKFASDGELGLHGTARVKRHTRVGAGSWCAGASAPTQGCEGAFMYLEFDNSTDDEAYYVLPIPARWDNTTDIEFSLDWYYTGTQDNGTVCWALEYKSIKDGEAIAGGTTTIAQTSAGTHTTGQMVRTTFTTKLLAVNLERGDTIGLRVFRDVDGGNDSGDTLATNARGINTHFRFVMNRLGDAT